MNKRVPIIVGLLFLILAMWLSISPLHISHSVLGRLENIGYDVQLRSRVLTSNKPISTQIAIIDIDDKSIKMQGRWPWPRSRLATLVDKLQSLGVVVIAFDIFFSEPQPNIIDVIINNLQKQALLTPDLQSKLEGHRPLFDEDSVFVASLAKSQSVLAFGFLSKPETQNLLPPPIMTLTPAMKADLQLFSEPGYISNLPVIQQAAKGGGFINIFPDEDGIVRRAPLVMEYQSNVYPALSLQAALAFLGEQVTLVTSEYDGRKRLEGLTLGSSYEIPTDSKGFVLIPFMGRSYTYPYYSATDVLEGNIPKDALLGKIVFVGTSATGLGDLQPTSIQSPFPGVEIQATLADAILEHHFYYNQAWTLGANVMLTLLLGLLAVFSFPYFSPRSLIFTILIFPVGLLYLNNIIWGHTGLILSFFMPVLLVLATAIFNIFYGYFFETRRREQLKSMFGQYVPETHINEMLKSKGKFNLHGEDREMTVMFADIRNFTAISETMNATELVDMLNHYFTPMTEIIHKHMGTVDKYIGDLIMAFWGAPLTDKDHAYHAILTAIEMQAKLSELRQLNAAGKWPEIVLGVGLNTGTMSVGDMGSEFRRNYTVMGDAVNLASRVESLSKFYGVNIVVTETTQRDQPQFLFRKLDRVQVKGKKLGIDIYEVIGLRAKVPAEVVEEVDRFHTGLDLYNQQRWDQALVVMAALANTYPDKKIYSIYVERIKVYQTEPPGAEWDGTYTHSEK